MIVRDLIVYVNIECVFLEHLKRKHNKAILIAFIEFKIWKRGFYKHVYDTNYI